MRRAQILTPQQNYLDARIYYVCTEGEKTEKNYFDLFQSSRVKVQAIPSEDGKSNPTRVLEAARRCKELSKDGPNDPVWIVFDNDRWEKAEIASVLESCRQERIRAAMSNPCFEVWLCLHFSSSVPNTPCKDLKKHLRFLAANQYPEGLNQAVSEPSWLDRVNEAVARARSGNPQSAVIPSRPGTSVHLLVEEILKFL